MTRPPIWFLDIDGVVNALAPGDGLVQTTAVCMDHPFTIHYSPELVETINACHRAGIVEIRWLSTWEQEARASFARAVGVDDFHAYDIPQEDTGRWYKAEVVDQVIAREGRSFVWTDDEVDLEKHGLLDQALGMPHLLVAPYEDRGLTPEDMYRVLGFLLRDAAGMNPEGDHHPHRPIWFLGDGTFVSTRPIEGGRLYEIEGVDYYVDVAVVERISAFRKHFDLDLRFMSDLPRHALFAIALDTGLGHLWAHVDPGAEESPMSFWKGQIAVDHLVGGRAPFVWTDHDIDDEVRESFSLESNVHLLAPSGDSLSHDELDEIERFLQGVHAW